jgi:hypothetical protein
VKSTFDDLDPKLNPRLAAAYKQHKQDRLIMKIIMGIGLAIVIICFTGWIKNIVKLSNCDFEAPYKCEVIHAVGIIPPVGAVTGYMDFGK